MRALVAAKKPDPTCATGVLSLAGAVTDKPQVCCPAYCGECSDYEACSSVRGQDSGNACCLSKVLGLECGATKTPANVCLKKCSEAVPPCIMEDGVVFKMPEMTGAADDCNEAVPDWMAKAEAAVKAAQGGDERWAELQKAGTIYNKVALYAAVFPAQTVLTQKKQCPTPKLSKTSMLQRAGAMRALVTAKKPDPTCATGVLSLAGAVTDKPQVCCPAYCGECSDYEACSSVRGQDSGNACCLSKVLGLECGATKTPANVCLKKCSEAVPPCIMEDGVVFKMPEMTGAADDCNEAVPDWMAKAEAAVKAAQGGDERWAELQKAGTIYNKVALYAAVFPGQKVF